MAHDLEVKHASAGGKVMSEANNGEANNDGGIWCIRRVKRLSVRH